MTEKSLFQKMQDWLRSKGADSENYRETPTHLEHLVTCKICNERVPKKQRLGHIRFYHPALRIKRKAWRLFN